MYKLHNTQCMQRTGWQCCCRCELLLLQSSGVGCCIGAWYFISEATTFHRPTANSPCDYLKLLHGRNVAEFGFLCLSADGQKGR